MSPILRVSRFAAADAFELILQPAQADELDAFDRHLLARAFEEAGQAFTVRLYDGSQIEYDDERRGYDAGRVIFCGGAVQRGAHYASLWAMFAVGKGRATHRLLGMTRRFIAELPHRRVDAMVEDLPAARRWAALAGLTLETTLGEAAPSGRDMLVYRRMQ